MVAAPPLAEQAAGVYLHFPFCSTRCSYCDFPTVAGRDERIVPYLAALEREIAEFQPELRVPVDSLFLGGGTPSRMTPVQVERVLRAVRARFEVQAPCEVTLECNPESLDAERLAGYREAGVTRVTVGVQSLDDGVLRGVRRGHGGVGALEALRLARATPGLDVAADLIAGLPGEDLAGWAATVARVAAEGPDHVSVYLIELDKNSPLAHSVRAGRTIPPADERLVAAYRATVAVLGEAGLEQYEISNFCRPGKASRHNLKYWTDAWFGGFGLGAHAYALGARRGNRSDLEGYLADLEQGRDPVQHRDPWEARRRLEEALMLGLRLVEGLDAGRLGRRYDVDVREAFGAAWERADGAGLIEWSDERVRLTERGRLCSNELFGDLLGGAG